MTQPKEGPIPFRTLAAGHRTPLLADCYGPEAAHYWSQAELDALTFAMAAQRPLLIRGEPGSGKSQVARAAAVELKSTVPIVAAIHPKYEATDLLYTFDTMWRLADSQVRDDAGRSILDSTNVRYVKQGPIWGAFRTSTPSARRVLLIDEIDKADSDLPNSLLHVLGARRFDVPMLGGKTISADDGAWPLILITTNEDRELPAAFVRRCGVLNLNPPDDKRLLTDWMRERARAHRQFSVVTDTAMAEAIDRVLQDREAAVREGFPPVGLAELIDLLHALVSLTKDDVNPAQTQLDWIGKLRAYALVKYQSQSGPGLAG